MLVFRVAAEGQPRLLHAQRLGRRRDLRVSPVSAKGSLFRGKPSACLCAFTEEAGEPSEALFTVSALSVHPGVSATPGSGGAACLPAGHLHAWFWAAGPGGRGAGGGGGGERNGASQQGPGSQDGAVAWREVRAVGAQGIRGLFRDRSDYEEMPLQNGQAIRAQYKEGSESD